MWVLVDNFGTGIIDDERLGKIVRALFDLKPAGIIKLSQNATGMTLTERKVLEAACLVARKTNAAIASHITAGPTALSVIDALEGFGCPLSKYRFTWIHSMVTAKSTGATPIRASTR